MDWSNCFLLHWCHLGVWVSLFQNDFIMAGKWCWLSARSLTLLVMWLLGLSHSMGTEFPDGIFQAAQLDVEDFWKPRLWSYKAMLESEEELKSLLIKVKEESEQPGLKLNIQKTNIMASGPITSWQIDGEKGEQWKSLLCWAPKSLQMVTAAMKLKDTCSLEKSYDNSRQHNKKQRHYFADKNQYSQSYGFSSSHVWMWELDHKEGWPLRIDAFEIWCWRRLLRVLCTARKSNQSILKEINPEYSLEGLMLKLKLQ